MEFWGGSIRNSKKYLFLQKSYIFYMMQQMILVHKKGTPPMRPLFYDFPNDETGWDIEDEFMFETDKFIYQKEHNERRLGQQNCTMVGNIWSMKHHWIQYHCYCLLKVVSLKGNF